tara:strand:+ start:432 stop:1625 length:1194 start_codon:yes stop_codon:yes gene_type:complete
MSIFNIIDNHEGLETNMKHLGIKYFNNKETGLTLLKYDQSNKSKYNFDNPLVSFSRGLVFDSKTNKIVCIPPEKSLHIIPFSQMVGSENWLDVTIEEFIDGTMINCFNHMGTWHISTRSYIGANCRGHSSKNYNKLFQEAKGDLDFEKLNIKYCYTFVLKHPENRIVKDHKVAGICLVQVREILDNSYNDISLIDVQTQLKEEGVDIVLPKRYTISKPEEINDLLSSMNYQEQGLMFKYNSKRSKVRTAEYENVKLLRGNNKNIFFNYIELRKNGMLMEYLTYFPEFTTDFDNFRKNIELTTMKLFNNYKEAYMYKKKNKKDIPFELRPLCYEMHGIYLSSKVKWDRQNVINFFNRLDNARIVFVVNFEKNKKFNLETNTVDKTISNTVETTLELSE